MPRKPGRSGDPSKPKLGGRKQHLGRQDLNKPSTSQDEDVVMAEPFDHSGDDYVIVDATDVRYADSDEAMDHTTRAALPLRELLDAITYEEVVYADPPPSLNFTENTGGELDASELEGVPSELIDDISPGAQPQPRIIPELLPKPKADLNDPSELIPSIQQNKFLEISQFEKALTAYIELTNMSRRDYASLVDVLRLLPGPDGSVHPLVAALPKQLSTLRDRLRRRLPLMKMRKAEIPLNVMKLPTLPPGMKADEREKIQAFKLKLAEHRRGARSKGKGKDKAISEHAPPTAAELKLLALDLPKITMNLTFFDPISVFKNFVASDIVKRSYSGPGTFVDNPTELYHSNAWLSSIRASSGHYAHVLVDGQPGPAIFPSEFIYYWCMDMSCFCQAISEDSEDIRNIHIGRVVGFGWDKRTNSCTLEFPHELALQVQEAFPVHRNNTICQPIQDDDELVLTSALTYIPESRAFSHAETNVFLDCYWGENMSTMYSSDTTRPKRGAPPTFPKYYTVDTPWVRVQEYYVVRRIIVGDELVPICHTHPPRAELELKVYGRELYANDWDSTVSGTLPVVSFPMLTFIDGFGVYRNSYRTLMGLYFTPAALRADERLRPGSIFPLVLGPHASDFGDVIAALRTMAYADHGIVEEINGQDTRICAFTMAYVGDMPQQAENSGLKGPRATRFCRFCNIVSAGKQISDPNQPFYIDVNQEGRFHNQTLQMQNMMLGLRSETAKEAYGKQWGLSSPTPALATISPALDLIVSRPMDPAHSEFSGLSTLAHYLLRDGILTKDASLEYALQLRVFPFPPGWQRLQSPVHHLASYDMSAHAQWSIIIPVLLRQWLKREHIKPGFFEQAEFFVIGTPVIDLVVTAFTKIVKSNVVLMGREISTEQRDNMAKIIQTARYAFNQLAMIAAASVGRSQAGSRVGTPARGVSATPGPAGPSTGVLGGESGVVVEAGRGLASQFTNDTLRPNVHIGMHYPIIANEYSLPVNVNTFTGENLHRWFKDRVFGSNYSNIEHVLLMKMNFQETLRLVLRGAFAYDDPELTAEMAELYQKCPSLFARVLSRADQMDIQDDSDYELDVSMSGDNMHANATVINRLPGRELAKYRHDVNNGQLLPLRSNSKVVHGIFRTHLRSAYYFDYGKGADYPSIFENKTIEWSRKFGFTHRESGDRFVFGCGQYVVFSREGQEHVGRVDHVMAFENFDDRHIFIVLSKLNRTGRRDELLDLEILEQTAEAVIVGIPAIKAQKLYMVPIDGVGVVLVDWDLYCL
ncbi:hypothetical protein CHU98_g7247 [Xylaria longipes]|nr:hypothetical protein CHU98_g7247 [Xylaria longipes]